MPTSASTTFKPRDATGAPVAHYYVVAVSLNSDSMGQGLPRPYAEGTSTYAAKIDGEGGFTLPDVVDSPDTGRYACHLVEMPDGSVTGVAGDASLALDQRYAQKVDEYVGAYGEPQLRRDRGVNELVGLYAVRLVDFDEDGAPELLLGYSDPAKTDVSGSNSAVTLEVWMMRDGTHDNATYGDGTVPYRSTSDTLGMTRDAIADIKGKAQSAGA